MPEPVSYTHLDVYKRQVYNRDCMIHEIVCETGSGAPYEVTKKAVSYTHLDVYKRQVLR